MAKMFDLGNYPGAVPSEKHEDVVRGDILKLKDPEKTLLQLDQYEAYDSNQPLMGEFIRDEVTIKLPDGEQINAWIYWYNLSVKGATRINEKDYLDYLKKKKSALYGA